MGGGGKKGGGAKPPPPPPPPPIVTSPEVSAEKGQARERARKRRGRASTILAGVEERLGDLGGGGPREYLGGP